MESLKEKREDVCVNLLLAVSNKVYSTPLLHSVSDGISESICGWRLAKPRPEYHLPVRRKKRIGGIGIGHVTSNTQLYKPSSTSLMSGKVTNEFDYVYDGGLSNKVMKSNSNTPVPGYTYSNVTLNPILINRSESMNKTARHDLQKLLKMQLKPDIAYEQMIIEQQLQSMDLNGLSQFSFDYDKAVKPQAHHSIPMQLIKESPKRFSQSDRHVPKQGIRPKRPKLKPFKWSLSAEQPTAFMRGNHHTSEPVLKTSFSRFLQSSSVMFSHKK